MARNDEFYGGGEGGFFKRHRAAVFAVVLVLFGSAGTIACNKLFTRHDGTLTARPVEIVPVILRQQPAPPPTPIAHATPPPTKDPFIVDPGSPVAPPAPPAPPAAPPAGPPISTGNTGTGPGEFNTGDGNGPGSNNITGMNGSRWGWYAGQVRTRIADALRENPRTRGASIRIQVRIWPDSTGRVTRAQLVDSTGDSATDNAIKNEVLTGLLLDAPPSDMPKPILLRLTASRAN